MNAIDISNEYFEWLVDLVCGERYSKVISYRKLLIQLHNTEFQYFISNDENRAKDGVMLRRRFALANNYDDDYVYDCLREPCSVLEMMAALSLRIEEWLMDDPGIGDRTRQWFWGMVVSLGLGSMTDAMYDKKYVTEALDRLINLDYEPDGVGGLFTIRDCEYDLRTVEIWLQANTYLNSIDSETF